MPCAIGCLAIFFPRITLVIIWLASDYLQRGYANVSLLWPILGFIFLPLTTLAYAFAINQNNGSVDGIYLAVVILAVLFDLGLLGGGGAAGKRHRSRTIEVTRVRAR